MRLPAPPRAIRQSRRSRLLNAISSRDLAMQCGVHRFAEFHPATRKRIEPFGRQARAPHQQDVAAAKDRRADGQLGMRRLDKDGAGINGS